MENFDNIYQKHFQDEQDGLSSKEELQLWDSIVEELGPDGSKVIKKKKFWQSKLFIGLLGAGIIFSAYFIGQYQGINANRLSEKSIVDEGIVNLAQNQDKLKTDSDIFNSKTISSTNNPITTTEHKIPEKSNLKNTNSSSNSNELSSDLIQSQNITVNQHLPSLNKDTKIFTKEGNTIGANAKRPIRNNSSETEFQFTNDINGNNEDKRNIVGFNEPLELKAHSAKNNTIQSEKINEPAVISGVSPINLEVQKNLEKEIKGIKASSSNDERSIYIANFISRYPLAFLKKDNKSFNPILNPILPKKSDYIYSFGLSSGANKSGILYTGVESNFINRKNDTERSYYAYNMGIDLGLEYKGKWLLKTGVQYEIQQTIYDETWINDILREGPFDEGVVVHPNSFQIVNLITDEKSKIYKSVNRLQQINTFKSVVIPIQLGWKMKSKKASYGVTAGSVIRIRQSQTGTILGEEGELVDLDNGGSHFYNSINMGLSLSPFFEYRISKRIGCNLSYNINMYRPSVFLSSEVNLYNYTQSINFGVHYYLNEN